MLNNMDDYFSGVDRWFVNNYDSEIIYDCVICGQSATILSDTHGEPDYKNRYSKCSCGFIWNNIQPTQEILDRFYGGSGPIKKWAEIKNTEAERERQGLKFSILWKAMNDNNIKSVLDVGCGNGFFLNHCQIGTDRVGIELSEDSRKHCNFPTYQDYDTFLNSIHNKKKYDLITMNGVLEHLKDPITEVNKYKEFMKYEGKLAVIVPNVDSLLVDTIGEEAATFCPQHLWYFNVKSLTALMEKCGLEIETYITIEPELQPILRKLKGFKPYQKIGIELSDRDITDQSIARAQKGYKIIAFFKTKR